MSWYHDLSYYNEKKEIDSSSMNDKQELEQQ